MKYSILASAIFASAYAAVVPREPQPCAPLEPSAIAEPALNTVENFSAFELYSDVARNASVPAGYMSVMVDTNAAVKSDLKYMHYYNFNTYDVSECAKKCDQASGCDSFNIYIHRSPSIEPAVACPNPKANTLITCALYGEAVFASEVTNAGQTRGPVDANGQAFEVVIAGSNVYNKLSAVCPPSTVTVAATTTETVTMMMHATPSI